MPVRQTIFAQDQIYHIFNRGVASQTIFLSQRHYSRFLQLIDYYRFANTPVSFSHLMKTPTEIKQQVFENLIKENKLQIEVLSFCLMPNHFHLLLKQILEKGIVKFMGNVQNSYVKYLNIKEKRVGPLFQSAFKAKIIETEEQLLHVSRYIHLNPVTAYLIKQEKLIEYPWSSLSSYLNNNNIFPKKLFVNTKIINIFFKTQENHKEFIFDQVEYQRELAKIKHLVLE